MGFSRFLMASVCCLALAACSSDGSVSLGTSAGGAGPLGATGANGSGTGSAGNTGASGTASNSGTTGSTGPAGAAGPAGPQGAQGANGTQGATGAQGATGTPGSLVGSNGLLSNGLGLTGSNGLVSYVIGSDPVGSTVDKVLGDNNGVSQLLGTPAGSNQSGLVTNILQVATGTSSTPILTSGLGLTGPNGVTTALLGSDVGGALLGTTGPIPASLAGGNNNLLTPVLGATSLTSGITNVIPTGTITGALGNVPQLGGIGAGGISTDLLGIDPVGNLLGTQNGGLVQALAGGNAGALGTVLNGVSPATQPLVGNLLSTATGQPASVQNVLQAGSPTNAVSNVIGTVTNLTNGLPVVGGVVQTATGATNGLPVVGGALQNVTGLTNNILNTATGALPAGGGSTPAGALGAVTQGVTSAITPASGLGSILGGLR